MLNLEPKIEPTWARYAVGVGIDKNEIGWRYGDGEDGLKVEIIILIYILFWVFGMSWWGVGGGNRVLKLIF